MGGNRRLVLGDYRRVDVRTEEERVEGRRETAEIRCSLEFWVRSPNWKGNQTPCSQTLSLSTKLTVYSFKL